jgi:uncharacterized protein (DUF305 family)
MNNQPIIYTVTGLIVGMIIAGFTASYAVNHNSSRMMQTFGMHYTSSTSNIASGNDMMDHASNTGDMSMNNMVNELKGRSGDDFDKAFLSEMLGHHQGAIDMASLVKNQAKHQEIKDLSEKIISAQTAEISQMKTWQSQWGY